MKHLAFRHAAVLDCDGRRENRRVVVDGGRIAEDTPDPGGTAGAREIDCAGLCLAPGLIDLHIHGALGLRADVSADALARLCAELPRFGVTGFLPTVTPCADDIELLTSLAAGTYAGSAILGFFLEGHFLTLTGAIKELSSAHSAARVRALIEAAAPYPVAFGVSPELDGLEALLPAMLDGGITPFITHTRAGVEATERAIEAGARHATHFYDVFPYPGDREPGVRGCGAVEAILADPRAHVDFILDGVHVEPAAVRMALACKGFSGVSLITDANVTAGLPAGVYKGIGGVDVIVESEGQPARELVSGKAGWLTGSSLTMIGAVRNAVRLLGCAPFEAIGMASESPARVLGLEGRKGRVAVGYDADLILLDGALNVRKTFVAGHEAYASA